MMMGTFRKLSPGKVRPLLSSAPVAPPSARSRDRGGRAHHSAWRQTELCF